MAAHGPEEAEVKDSLGTVYRLGRELGHGIEGRTHKATVLKTGKKEKNLHPGDEVAIKIQRPSNDEFTIEARRREIDVLQKEGTLLAVKHPGERDSDQSLLIVQPIFPGVDLRTAMYEIKDELSGVGEKKSMSSEQKEMLANSLLNDYFAMQQLGIVHCDIKPDNILYDQNSGTAKIIDMGQAFNAVNGSPHETFQGPSSLYMPPEIYEPNGSREHKNSAQSDMYSLGIVIASLYSELSYEKDAVDYPDNNFDSNPAINVRAALADVIGDGVKHKEGMPDHLLSIVQHLTAVSPENRPQNIALARGADKYQGTQSIYLSQERAEQFKSSQLGDNLMRIFSDRSLADDFKDGIRHSVHNNQDLPAIRNELVSLKKNFPGVKKIGNEIDKLTSKIDEFTGNESTAIQLIRIDSIEHYKSENSKKMYSDSIKGFIAMLDGEARQLKADKAGKPIGGGIAMIMSGPVNTTQLNHAGKMLLLTSKMLANQKDPSIISESLERLKTQLLGMDPDKFGENAEKTKEKLLTKVDTLIARHEQVKALISEPEPEKLARAKKR